MEDEVHERSPKPTTRRWFSLSILSILEELSSNGAFKS